MPVPSSLLTNSNSCLPWPYKLSFYFPAPDVWETGIKTRHFSIFSFFANAIAKGFFALKWKCSGFKTGLSTRLLAYLRLTENPIVHWPLTLYRSSLEHKPSPNYKPLPLLLWLLWMCLCCGFICSTERRSALQDPCGRWVLVLQLLVAPGQSASLPSSSWQVSHLKTRVDLGAVCTADTTMT